MRTSTLQQVCTDVCALWNKPLFTLRSCAHGRVHGRPCSASCASLLFLCSRKRITSFFVFAEVVMQVAHHFVFVEVGVTQDEHHFVFCVRGSGCNARRASLRFLCSRKWLRSKMRTTSFSVFAEVAAIQVVHHFAFDNTSAIHLSSPGFLHCV